MCITKISMTSLLEILTPPNTQLQLYKIPSLEEEDIQDPQLYNSFSLFNIISAPHIYTYTFKREFLCHIPQIKESALQKNNWLHSSTS